MDGQDDDEYRHEEHGDHTEQEEDRSDGVRGNRTPMHCRIIPPGRGSGRSPREGEDARCRNMPLDQPGPFPSRPTSHCAISPAHRGAHTDADALNQA